MAPVCAPILEKPFSWHQLTHSNSTFTVSRIIVGIVFTNSSHAPYKSASLHQNILMHIIFSFFHFHPTLFHVLMVACVNPGKFTPNSHFVHSFVCQITYSFLKPNLVSALPLYALSVILFST